MTENTVEFIVLKKTPYRESAFIVQGITPDNGKMSFIIHGARTVEGKKFPIVDLLRQLSITYKEKGNGQSLYTATNVELISHCDEIALVPELLTRVLKTGLFLLANSAEDLGSPLVYETFRNFLANARLLAENPSAAIWNETAASIAVKMVFLYENGLLPVPDESDPKADARTAAIESIISAGVDGTPFPRTDEVYLTRINRFLNHIIRSQNLPLK